MATGAPNIVLVMSDQHRADMMGCAGDAASSRRHSTHWPPRASASRGSRARAPLHAGAGLVHDGALRPRPRRLHQFVGDPAGQPDLRLGAPGGRLPHALLGKAHLYLDEQLDRVHIDDMAGRLEALGFAEVFETGDKFVGKIPTRYTDYLAGRGLLDVYKQHIADRSYQGENEDGQNATKCVPMWDSTPMPLPLEAYVDAWHGLQAVEWIEGYYRQEPFFLFVGFPGPHDPWDAPEAAVQRYRDVDISMPALDKRPTIGGRVATAHC